MRLALAAILLASAVPAVAASPSPKAMSPGEVPPSLAPLVERAEAAIEALRSRLFARLNELIVERGPVGAIEACSAEAPVIARQLGETNQVEVGRTSHRLRNPANAPRPWAAAYVAQSAAARKGGDVAGVVLDLGDRIGVLRPITVMPACTRCHGAVDGIDADVKAHLSRHYQKDQATGFAPGDHRGFVWAEVKKR